MHESQLERKTGFLFPTSISLNWRWKIWAFCEFPRQEVLGLWHFQFPGFQKIGPPPMWIVRLPLPMSFVSFEAWNLGAMPFQFLGIQNTCRPLMWDVSCHEIDFSEFVKIVNVWVVRHEIWGLWHYQFLDFQKIILLPCGLPVAMPLIIYAFCETCGCLWALWILWGMISGSYGNFSFWVSKRLFLSCESQVVNGLAFFEFCEFCEAWNQGAMALS